MNNSINTVRTKPELIERQNWLSKNKWFAVVTAHFKTDISDLTMGKFQNYACTEFTFSIFGDQIRINKITRHNENACTGDLSSPYKPENYPAELIPLFNQLIELTRNK